ncbi:sulfite exporter TauE/SafE family protein [uncultured Erythrobacter sp.]|uniref:TSUP family transporter n=1 Tax=uncultured Erythrobacter sp. TaxID=263913 RepID=UPI00265A1DB2|nr:sulfite exporter TauE/SafE family protein [uncultured Erythrobacter sp.]
MEVFGGFTALQIAVALAAALGSAFVRGLTGFGMAILLVPVLALALPPVEAVVLANALSLMIGATEIRSLVRDAEPTAWAIGGLVVLTAPLGLYALSLTGKDVARLAIALIALSAFVAILLPKRGAAVPGRLVTGGVGVLSGLMTGFAGMPGPPVVPYYAGRDLPRPTIKASMQLIFTIAACAGLASATWLGILRPELLLFALLMLPMIIAGNRLGARVSGRISDPLWRVTVGLILGGAAVAAFARLI